MYTKRCYQYSWKEQETVSVPSENLFERVNKKFQNSFRNFFVREILRIVFFPFLSSKGERDKLGGGKKLSPGRVHGEIRTGILSWRGDEGFVT